MAKRKDDRTKSAEVRQEKSMSKAPSSNATEWAKVREDYARGRITTFERDAAADRLGFSDQRINKVSKSEPDKEAPYQAEDRARREAFDKLLKSGTPDQLKAEIAATEAQRERALMSNDQYMQTGRDVLKEQIGMLKGALADRGGATLGAQSGGKSPAVPIDKSVTPDHIINLDTGKRYKSMKRALAQSGETPEQYRARWGLPTDYPMVASGYVGERAKLARQMGSDSRDKTAPKSSNTDPQAGAQKAPAAVSGAAKPLDKLSMAELKAMAAEHGIAPGRSKQMMVQRIEAARGRAADVSAQKSREAAADAQLERHLAEKNWYDQRDLKPREMPDRPGMDPEPKADRGAAAKKEKSNLRGTQNAANLNAIVENKKAKAKGKPAITSGADRLKSNTTSAKVARGEIADPSKNYPEPPKSVLEGKYEGGTTKAPPADIGTAPRASRAPLDIGAMVREKAAQVMAETKPIVDPLKLIDKRNETARSLAEQTKVTGVDDGRGAAARDLVARNDRAIAEMSNAEKVRTLNATAMGAKRKVFNEPAKPSPAEAYESKFGHKPPSGMSEGAMERWTSSPFKAAPGTPGDPAYEAAVKRAQSKFYTAQYRNIAASGAKPAATPPAPKASPSKAGKAVTTGLAALGPIAIGASAVQAAGETRARGGSTSDMLKAGTKAAAGTTAGIGGFMIGQAAAVKGAVKLGMSVAKAVPMVNAAMIVGGAVHGAWTHRSEGAAGMAKGAAQGAWDMWLPVMVVNTGIAVKDAAKAWQTPAGPTSFQAASDRFSAMRHAASQSETGDKKKGWSNAARIGAYKARMAKSGSDATNLPYGGAVEPPKPLKG